MVSVRPITDRATPVQLDRREAALYRLTLTEASLDL